MRPPRKYWFGKLEKYLFNYYTSDEQHKAAERGRGDAQIRPGHENPDLPAAAQTETS